MTGTSDAEGLLRGASLRVTRPRVAVLTAVHELPHSDTDSIGVVRRHLDEVSTQEPPHESQAGSVRAL